MFTGIIQGTAKVVSAQKEAACLRVRIKKPIKKTRQWKLALGASVSIDGICSTVMAQSEDAFEVEYMPETLLKTTAGSFATGALLNLERSLTLNDLIDGHIVQGHVDARARVASVETAEGTRRIVIELPQYLRRYVAALGSIAINGVSLTVATLKGARATVALIPHTLSHTNLGLLKKGDMANVEVDVMARYIVAALEASGRVGHAKKTLRKRAAKA